MNNMWGSLPPELYHLQYLKTLFISDNEMLSGEIPFQYGWWKFLDARKLFDCLMFCIVGTLMRVLVYAREILPTLPILFLFLLTLSHLIFLCNTVVLAKNNLIGKIPHSFAYLKKLRTLRLEVRVNV
jgi:hypothetical protein